MATDEEYLDNLLKSLTGGDEPIMEPVNEPEDAADENDNLKPKETEAEEEAADNGIESAQPDTEGADGGTESAQPDTEDAGDGIESAQPDMESGDGIEGLQSDLEVSDIIENLQPGTEAGGGIEDVKPDEEALSDGIGDLPGREIADDNTGNLQPDMGEADASAQDVQSDMEEDEGESFLDSLDMELDNVENWNDDLDELLAQTGGTEENPLDTPLPPAGADEGNIDDPELMQMFENLESGDTDLEEINSLLNNASMNEGVDDDMLALLESAGDGQNYEDSEETFDIFAEGEMDELSSPNIGVRTGSASENEGNDSKKKKKKKPGFLAKLFALLLKEAGESEEDKAGKPDKEDDVSDANAKLLKELSGGGGKKAAAKEKKKAPKKDKKKKAKPAAKPKPPKPKKVKEKKPAVAEKPVKVLNKKGLISIIALCATIIAGVYIVSSLLPQYVSKQEARIAFNNGDYETTYELFYKKKLSKKETELYNKAKTVRRIERKLQSYKNNMAMDRELEAVDALFLGIKCYEGLREADTYDVRLEVDAVYQEICSILESSYGISQEEAISITKLDNVRYTKKLKALVGELAEPEEAQSSTAEGDNPEEAPSADEDSLPDEDSSAPEDILPEEEDMME